MRKYPIDNDGWNWIECQRKQREKKLGVRITKKNFSKYWIIPNLKKIERRINNATKNKK